MKNTTSKDRGSNEKVKIGMCDPVLSKLHLCLPITGTTPVAIIPGLSEPNTNN